MRHENTLDLFLMNRPSLVNRCEPLPGLGDHEIVYIDTDISAKLNKPVKRKKRQKKKKKINWKTKHQKWLSSSEKFSLDSAINEMRDFFKSNILKILQESVPSKMSSSRFSQPRINRTVKQMTRRKKRSFDKAKRTKKKSDIARYRKLKSATQKECRKAYKDYVENFSRFIKQPQKILELH